MIVYIYTFPNGKKYIGQTLNTLERRAGSNGINYRGQPVYNAIQKYGWNNIQKEIFECETQEEMDALEIKLITKYHSANRNFGYNLESGGHIHKELSLETRRKISEAIRGENHPNFGKHLSQETKDKIGKANHGKLPYSAKPVICIETGKIYDSTGIAAESLGLKSYNNIANACNGRQKTSCGYHWAYLEDYNKNAN